MSTETDRIASRVGQIVHGLDALATCYKTFGRAVKISGTSALLNPAGNFRWL